MWKKPHTHFLFDIYMHHFDPDRHPPYSLSTQCEGSKPSLFNTPPLVFLLYSSLMGTTTSSRGGSFEVSQEEEYLRKLENEAIRGAFPRGLLDEK